jgi:microcystin-dependent protein
MNPFIGQIQAFGFNFAPRGWALCDGQLLQIAQNTALFSLLGTIYGGDGRTTFKLPDLRGRTMINYGNGPGLPAYRIGQVVGTEQVALNVLNMPSHDHDFAGFFTVGVSDEDANASEGNGKYLAGAQAYTDQAANGHLAGAMVSGGVTVGNTGGSQPFNIMNPYQVVNYCIALVGIYPSRP